MHRYLTKTSLFHSKGPQTLNLRSSNLEKVRRTKRKLALEERKEREDLCLQTKSSKYEGETSFYTLNTCNKVLNMRRKRTGNHCNFIRVGVM